MTRTLLALFFLCSFAVAQDPAADVAAALLHKDAAAAARVAGTVTSPAARARLQAALLPSEQRPAAMLAVAQAFPNDLEADQALLAGAAAVLLELLRDEALPGLAMWCEVEGDRPSFHADSLRPVVLGLRDAVATRVEAGGDQTTLHEAQRLLDLACVSRFGLWPARVAVGASWERPAGLAEALQLRAMPCGPGHVRWDQLDALGSPGWSGVMPVAGPFALPSLPAGHWLLEARSALSPWRGVRVVEVSDLEVVALENDGLLVLGAFDPQGPAAAHWQFREDGAELQRGELGAAPVLVTLGKAAPGRYAKCEVCVQGAAGPAWLDAWRGAGDYDHGGDRWLVHTMVDRPLYQPGETVQGRIVLRSCTWSDSTSSRVPTTAPAPDQPVQIVVDLGSLGERVLPARTDAHGIAAFSFVVPAEVDPGTWFNFAVQMPETNADDKPLRLYSGYLCGTSNYRRQAVRVSVVGPEKVLADAPFVEIVALAEWASGGPAAGLDVTARVNARNGWEREEKLSLRTDADGRATVRVPVAGFGAQWISVDFEVTGPDGLTVRDRCTVDVLAPTDAKAAAMTPPAWLQNAVPDLELGVAEVGSPCRVTLRGAVQQRALLVVGRGSNARVQAVQLGADGVLVVDVPVLRFDWPRFDVAVATGSGRNDEAVPVRLRAVREPTIDVPEQATPGSEVSCLVRTDAPGAVITVAVVDERIFELAEDRTPDPEAAMQPYLPRPRWNHFARARVQTPADLLSSLLERGRLPPVDDSRDLSQSGSGAGGRGAGDPGGPGGLRSRFCATATFTTVIADADGVASAHFRLPDDLTRWRITAVGITAEGSGFTARRSFASRQPLAAEPVLPRGVRAGDAFALPLAIDRASDATAEGDTATVTAACEGAALQVERATSEVAVSAGRVSAATVPLRALAAGEATLSLAVTLGTHEDHSSRTLTIGRDAVVRPLAAAALGTGSVTVGLPDGTSPDSGIVVDVLQGGSAAWQQLEQDLAAYPYGCVEQTLARLVPYFAMARAAKARGEPVPAMDVGFTKRLHAGLARLRELQVSSGQFAFWPGGEADPRMSALVLHGLAVLRSGGCDLERTGLSLEAYHFDDAVSRPEGLTVVDAAFVAAAELLAAGLRLHPENEYQRRLLQPVLDVLPQLPAGLCARLGLALHAAGDAAGARACFERLPAATTQALGADGFPGEDPLAVQALRLELATALQQPAADRDRAAAELLLACLRGGGSTYAHACALAALAQALPRTEVQTGTIEVRVGAEVRSFPIGGERGAAVHWRLPRAAAVTVRGPLGMPLLVRIAAERSERASDHAAWATPIRVEREFCTSRADATWDERRDGSDLVPLQGPPLVGRPLVLRVRVVSPVPMRYVVVDCPLPAGFELANEPTGIDRFTDRVAFACDLQEAVPFVQRLELVPTVAGRLVWPPCVASPMYATGFEGGSAGSFLEVAAVPPGVVPSVVTCLRGPAPANQDVVPDPLDEFCAAILAAWEPDEVDEGRSHREVEALLAARPPAGDGSPLSRLDTLTDLLRRMGEPKSDVLRPETFWRLAAYEQLRGLHQEATLAAFLVPVRQETALAERQVYTLQWALGIWSPSSARERLLGQLLERARVFAPSTICSVIDCVDAPPRDPELLAALRACLASPEVEVRNAAFLALPEDVRAQLPPVLVFATQQGECDEGVIAMLARNDAGAAELRMRLRDPAFVVPQRLRLAAELPSALWRDVPLAAFAALASAVVEESDDALVGPKAVAAYLAAGPLADAELQRAMAAAKVPAWRFVLALALHTRGVKQVHEGGETADAFWSFWTRALGLGVGDAGPAVELLGELRARAAADRVDNEADLLVRFVMPTLVAAGSAQQVYQAAAWMDETRWAAVWARLPGAERVALVDQFRKHVSDTFAPATPAEAEALWHFLLRSGDVDGAVGAMTCAESGIECLRQHLAAGEGGEHAAKIREFLAKRLGLDPATFAANLGEEVHAVVNRLQRRGFAGAWSVADRDRLHRLRALRGLGAVGG
jgi:hypothetical protein